MSKPKAIRTLIVDDEAHARTTLRLLLKQDPDVVIVGEAGDGDAALEAIESAVPDLVFLDVQMPEKTGFDVIANLPAERQPQIVFVTAYDQYAVNAFDVNAVDYLLKPFDDARFFVALDRAKQALRAGRADMARQIGSLLAAHRGDERLRRFAIKSGGRVRFVEVETVDWIAAADQYVELHTGQQTHLLRGSLTAMEGKLPREFCRIHRSAIVNVERIVELRPEPAGDSVVVLRGGAELRLARNRRQALEAAMGI